MKTRIDGRDLLSHGISLVTGDDASIVPRSCECETGSRSCSYKMKQDRHIRCEEYEGYRQDCLCNLLVMTRAGRVVCLAVAHLNAKTKHL